MVIGLVVVVPAAYEIFRMGYYAAIVPNTALAKEASTARWSQGFTYLGDFVGTYWLWVPVLLAGIAGVPLVIAARRRGLDAVMLVVVPVVAGCVHALYVVRVGGDFMHARMLLPSLFVLLLPVMVIAVTVRTAAVCGAVAIWAVVCAVALRVPYEDSVGKNGIGDERGFYTSQAVRRNAMTVDDYRGFILGDMGHRLRTFVDGGGHGLILDAQSAPGDVLPLANGRAATGRGPHGQHRHRGLRRRHRRLHRRQGRARRSPRRSGGAREAGAPGPRESVLARLGPGPVRRTGRATPGRDHPQAARRGARHASL